MPVPLQMRRGTAAQWAADNPILKEGEIAFILDANGNCIGEKRGNGTDPWNTLTEYAAGAGVSESQARTIAVEEVEREIYNPLTAINTELNAGL